MTVVRADPDAIVIQGAGRAVYGRSGFAAAAGPRIIMATCHRLGINGFCRGGRQMWLYAAHSTASEGRGFVVRPCSTARLRRSCRKTALEVIPEMKCPVLGLYGSEMRSIPMNRSKRRRQEAKEADKTVRVRHLSERPDTASTPTTGRATARRTRRMAGTAPWRGFATTGCNVESGLTRRRTDQAIVVTDNTLSSA